MNRGPKGNKTKFAALEKIDRRLDKLANRKIAIKREIMAKQEWDDAMFDDAYEAWLTNK